MTEQPTVTMRARVLSYAGIGVGLFAIWFFVLGGNNDSTAAHPTPTPRPTVEYMLAAIHGDLGSEAEFKRIVDRIQAGGSLCAPEPNRRRVGDVIVASWEDGGKADSLLAWARALASICGP